MKDDETQKVLSAFLEKPTTYTIEVIDNSMLPAGLKKEKLIDFTIKPPTLEVLAKCAMPMTRVPESLREAKDIKIDEAVKYVDEMIESLSILIHGKSSDPPEWHKAFFMKNLTTKEVYLLFYESILKLQTDFFLNSFQIVGQNNPMMMMKKMTTTTKIQEDSIPIGS